MAVAMRILVVAHNHPSFHPGGAETVAWDLHCRLREQGHESFFLAGLDPIYRPEHAGTNLQALPDDPSVILFRSSGFDPFMQLQTRYDHLLFDLRWLLEDLKPDLVHVQHLNYFGVELLALIHRVLPATRIVYTLHDYLLICGNDGLMVRTGTDALCDRASPDRCYQCFPNKRPATFQVRKDNILRHLHYVDRFTAPSDFLRDRFVEWGLEPSRIEVCPNGLPDVQARPTEMRKQRNRFAVFGNMRRTKGTLIAARAAVQAIERYGADLTLTLYGEAIFQQDEFKAELQELVDRAKGSIELAGRFERDQVPGLMASIDWAMCPSLWWENAPLVIQEAFAQKRPVICSDIGGMAEAVRHDVDGIHVRVGDVDEWARTMAVLADDSERWEAMSTAIRQPDDVSKMTEGFLDIYETALKSGKTTSPGVSGRSARSKLKKRSVRARA
jgi:glycosyltransferase involved in cell wall biosynthesis